MCVVNPLTPPPSTSAPLPPLPPPLPPASTTATNTTTYFVHQVSEGQEGYLVEGHRVQVVDVSLEGLVYVAQETDGLKVARRGYRESHHVPYSLVEARVGAVPSKSNNGEG